MKKITIIILLILSIFLMSCKSNENEIEQDKENNDVNDTTKDEEEEIDTSKVIKFGFEYEYDYIEVNIRVTLGYYRDKSHDRENYYKSDYYNFDSYVRHLDSEFHDENMKLFLEHVEFPEGFDKDLIYVGKLWVIILFKDEHVNDYFLYEDFLNDLCKRDDTICIEAYATGIKYE